MRFMAMLAVLLALIVACGESEPELPELVEEGPATSLAPPPPTPEPSPTPTPGGDLGLASEIASAWVDANPGEVAAMVVEAALGSEDFDGLPLVVRPTLARFCGPACQTGWGTSLP